MRKGNKIKIEHFCFQAAFFILEIYFHFLSLLQKEDFDEEPILESVSLHSLTSSEAKSYNADC